MYRVCRQFGRGVVDRPAYLFPPHPSFGHLLPPQKARGEKALDWKALQRKRKRCGKDVQACVEALAKPSIPHIHAVCLNIRALCLDIQVTRLDIHSVCLDIHAVCLDIGNACFVKDAVVNVKTEVSNVEAQLLNV